MKKKLFVFLLISSIFFQFSNISYAIEKDGIIEKNGENKQDFDIENEKDSIKKVLETFIKDDYNYNGGKNDFSTIGNEQLKKYLLARNTVKATNHKTNYKKVLSQNFEFNYKDFAKLGNYVKVNVYMLETYLFKDEDTGQLNEAGAGNDYIVYLSKINGEWKVMSATIDVDIDAVDDEFDVNKELGYEGNKTQKNIELNLNKMLNKLNDLEDAYSKPINGESLSTDPDIKYDVERGNALSATQRKAIYNYAYDYRMHRRNPNYLSFETTDCANYASQALRKAGARADKNHSIVIDGKKRTWSLTPDSFHIQPTYGDAWAQAHYLRAFIVRNENGYRGPGGHAIGYGSKLELGDLTFIYHNECKKWFHTYIVIEPGPNFKIACHTKDRWGDRINDAAPESKYPRSYVHLTSLN